MSSPTLDQLHTLHAKERAIFSKLVIKFKKPPSESLLVMATWFWLKSFGYEDIFSTIYSLSDHLIPPLANEAVSCFQCIESSRPPEGLIPLTSSHMQKHISLPMIHKNRYTAIAGIKTFLTTVCSRIFTDILTQALRSSPPIYYVCGLNKSLFIPGFPHKTFGNINVILDVADGDNTLNNNSSLFPNGLWEWNDNCMESENDRALLLTFSRHFPVSQADVRELFTNMFGEKCGLGLYMRECVNNDHQQLVLPQFAKVVLDSVITVDRVLQGEKLQEFWINGKHIWASKYKERTDGHICFT